MNDKVIKTGSRNYSYRGVGFTKGSAKNAEITVFIRTANQVNAVCQFATLTKAANYVDLQLNIGATVENSRLCYKVVA